MYTFLFINKIRYTATWEFHIPPNYYYVQVQFHWRLSAVWLPQPCQGGSFESAFIAYGGYLEIAAELRWPFFDVPDCWQFDRCRRYLLSYIEERQYFKLNWGRTFVGSSRVSWKGMSQQTLTDHVIPFSDKGDSSWWMTVSALHGEVEMIFKTNRRTFWLIFRAFVWLWSHQIFAGYYPVNNWLLIFLMMTDFVSFLYGYEHLRPLR